MVNESENENFMTTIVPIVSEHDKRASKPINMELAGILMNEFNKNTGPTVGHFLKLPRIDSRQEEFTRFTHDWGDSIQTGGNNGSFFHFGISLSYSGSLDSGLKTCDIIPTQETRPGGFWFFDEGTSGAGRAVNYLAPFRVFETR